MEINYLFLKIYTLIPPNVYNNLKIKFNKENRLIWINLMNSLNNNTNNMMAESYKKIRFQGFLKKAGSELAIYWILLH